MRSLLDQQFFGLQVGKRTASKSCTVSQVELLYQPLKPLEASR